MEAKANIKIEASITFTVTEGEARALSAIMGYGSKPFIEGFYSKMGKHYLMPHEKHVHTLFDSVQKSLNPALAKIEMIKGKM